MLPPPQLQGPEASCGQGEVRAAGRGVTVGGPGTLGLAPRGPGCCQRCHSWCSTTALVPVLDPEPLTPASLPPRLLLQAGYDPELRDGDGWTPLHAAAHWGVEDACRLLAEHGGGMDSLTHAVRP